MASKHMDPALANQLFDEGAMLVFLDVPPGTEFGIDYNSWNVGPKFKGVKMIPPGIHFVYHSAVDQNQQVAPRTGFFHNFHAREIVVKHWDPQLEDMRPGTVSAEEQQRMEDNKQDMDRYLGAYPYDTYKKWVSLTNYLNSDLLDRMQPRNRRICSVMEFQSSPSTTQSRRAAAAKNADADTSEKFSHLSTSSASDNDDAPSPSKSRRMESLLPDMKPVEGTVIGFTQLPKKTYPEGSSASEMTKYSMDHSYVLEQLLNSVYKDDEMNILGEVQFAFVCFLIGQVFDGFEQWKQLVRLLCSCDEALSSHADLYSNFINLMHYHIREIPEDFFVDIVTKDNFLVSILHTFFDNLRSNDHVDNELKKKGNKFLHHLQKKFQWDFSSELEDDAPVIVE